MDESHRYLFWVYTLPELVVVAGTFLLLAVSELGGGSFLSSVSRPIRLALLAFLAVELLIPLWVWVDLRRRPERSNSLWVHAAAMPVVNIFGLFAYLADRNDGDDE